MSKYRLVWFDDNKYHTHKFESSTDNQAIEVSKAHDMGLGICFDLLKDNKIIFNDDIWNKEIT